ncbi:MAG: type II secretion system F family protein [Candidatus Pacearchaeota archaeon]
MEDKNRPIRELGNNISETKKIANEINSLLRELKKVRNEDEKRLISTQIENLRKNLRETSKKTLESIEKISLYKPLPKSPPIESSPFDEEEIIQTPQKTTQIQEQTPAQSNIQNKSEIKVQQKSEKLELTPLERISFKKIKKEKTKVIENIKKQKKPSRYVNLANKYFYKLSDSLVKKGKFQNLGRDIVKSNMDFILPTYVSVIFFSTFLAFFVSIIITIFFLFFNISSLPPFLIPVNESLLTRFLKIFWIILILPASTFLFSYFYPSLEKKAIENKINQELPFATIHMSSITGSMVDPSKIFKIIIETKEYPNLEKEFIKLQNEINVYGYDLVTALRNRSFNSPSRKLSELYNGLITTITSGGNIPDFFEKRAQTLLFEHRLDMERQAKTAETFMDIYISVVIAAPMILMLLLIMMRISGFGISLSPLMITLIMVLSVTMVNIMFLTFLHLKQPKG